MERVPKDMAAYVRRSREGPCFVCATLDGHPDYRHQMVYDDGDHVAFLAMDPTLLGYTIVSPRRHVEDVVRGLTPSQYLALQSAVHTVARAVAEVTAAEEHELAERIRAVLAQDGSRPR